MKPIFLAVLFAVSSPVLSAPLSKTEHLVENGNGDGGALDDTPRSEDRLRNNACEQERKRRVD
jgi:hypothetical protein